MVEPFLGVYPVLDDSNFVSPTSVVIGDVVLGHLTSVWFGAVIRGDVNRISIGERSNVQDNAVVHVTNRTAPTTIGSSVSIGHQAVVHGCSVGDRVLLGIGCVVLDHAEIGDDCIIGAGAVVTPGTRIAPGSLVVGVPARIVRQLTEEELDSIRRNADNYVKYSRIYRGIDKPDVNPFYDRGASGS